MVWPKQVCILLSQFLIFSIRVFCFFFAFFIVISHSGLCTKRNHHSPGNLTFFYHLIVHFFVMSFLVSASSLNDNNYSLFICGYIVVQYFWVDSDDKTFSA